MKYKKFFNEDKKISLLGFGAWQLGNTESWQGPNIDEGIALVREAYEKGITFYDTAPNYGQGNSEKILGMALQNVRDNVFINTKVGHGPEGESEFTKAGIYKSVDRSLKKLRTTYLDSVILHNPELYILEGKSDLFSAFEELKAKGKIRHYGVSIDTPEELALALQIPNLEVIELLFNINHQAAKKYFKLVEKKGILLITKVPLDSGWLTGKYDQDSTFSDIRSRWTKEIIHTRAKIVDKIKEIVETDDLVGSALSYIASFEAVGTIIPGVRNLQQLNSNLKNIDYKLTKAQRAELEKLYDDYISKQDVPW